MRRRLNARTVKLMLYDVRREAVRAAAHAAPGFWITRLRNPIFIVGMARSGTTLLEELIAQHPGVANWSEANPVWDPTGWEWRYSKRETLPMWADPAGFHARWRRDVNSRERDIPAMFGLFQTFRGRPFLLNKNPDNTWRIPFILDHFPNAKFIHLIRDGRAVVSSNFSRIWPKPRGGVEPERHHLGYTYVELAIRLGEYWQENLNEVAAQDAAHHLTERGILLEVAYEDLAADLRGTLARICDHTGLSLDRFRDSVWATKVENRNDKWRKNLRPEAVEAMVAAMQPALSERGYAEIPV